MFHRKKYILAGIFLLPLAILAGLLLASSHASALFNYTNHPMDDAVMRASATMSANDIQVFLNNKGSGLAGFSDIEDCSSGPRYSANAGYYAVYFACGQRRSAAQIIYDSAQAWGINPQAILATMQKEESLVTNPNPTSSNLTYAMGYGCPDSGGCSFPGFFNQVDWGTWQFRADMELSSGNSFWGWAPSSYPCNGATRYYDQALVAGNDVTFIDDHSIPYTHFVLPNSSTAALYCYTPHVYPGSSQEYYSGSYWFVYYYNLWFTPYAWSPAGYAGFANSARTFPFNRGSGISIAPGSKAYIRVQARNNGYQSWTQSVVHLGTSGPQDRCSPFGDSSWLAAAPCQRIAMANSSAVAPGGIATFDFSLTAPATTGSYQECFKVVAEGITWLNDPSVCFAIDVVNTRPPANVTNSLSGGQSLYQGHYLMSTDTHSLFTLQSDGNAVLYTNFLPFWSTATSHTNANRLAMQTDGNLVLYSSTMQPLWNSQTSGNPGAYFILQTDGNAVVYSSANVALWASGTNGVPDGLSYVTHLIKGASLHPMQQLQTADAKYRLIFQPDGNLVLYSPSRALWSSQTNGKPASFVAMQSDGNLVIYDTSLKPLWASGTDGQGPSRLIMQDDGNLVIYNGSNQPTWNTVTSGKQ